MKKQDYQASFQVSAAPEQVFQQINAVRNWWSENIDGDTNKDGGVFSIHFGETFVTMKIITFIPGKKVVWYVTDCYLHWLADKKEWKDTEVVFDITPAGNGTNVSLTHVGLTPQVECYEGCVKGWDQYFKDSLAKLINEGAGLPQKKAVAEKETV